MTQLKSIAWEKLHEQACKLGEFSYIDPGTGFQVFTKLYHLDRGHCCESGCRHCPYGFNSNPETKEKCP